MARKISEIYDAIIVEKETFSSLAGLTSPVTPDTSQNMLTELTTASKVAIWRLIFHVIAVAIFAHESLFDIFKSDIEKRAKEIVPATIRFYVIESLKFQLGDELEFINDKFQYSDSSSIAAITKQIIKQASARDVNTIVTIKLAKDDGSGGLEKLTLIEKTAFESYLNNIKIAGTKTIVISDDPDLLKAAYTIQFDPLVMKPDGSLIEDSTFPVQIAIDKFIKGLDFDNIFRVQDLTDAIQAARGVVNAVTDVIDTKFGALEYSNVLLVPTETFLPNAGYLITDPSPIVILTPPEYDSSLTYSTGDQVRFEGIVYEAKQDIAVPEAFDPTKWNTISNLTFISV